jgi:hypothetical protein
MRPLERLDCHEIPENILIFEAIIQPQPERTITAYE